MVLVLLILVIDWRVYCRLFTTKLYISSEFPTVYIKFMIMIEAKGRSMILFASIQQAGRT